MRWLVAALAVAVALAGASPPAAAQSISTLADLLKKHDSSACQNCHDKVHAEWTSSFHARSVVQGLGSLRAYIAHLENERKVPADKLLTYHHRPGEEFVVHKSVRKVEFR